MLRMLRHSILLLLMLVLLSVVDGQGQGHAAAVAAGAVLRHQHREACTPATRQPASAASNSSNQWQYRSQRGARARRRASQARSPLPYKPGNRLATGAYEVTRHLAEAHLATQAAAFFPCDSKSHCTLLGSASVQKLLLPLSLLLCLQLCCFLLSCQSCQMP